MRWFFGVPTLPLPDSLRRWKQRFRRAPDPLTWRAAIQFTRNPQSERWLLAGVTLMLSALLAVYSLYHHRTDPAAIGGALYQTYFSITQLFVMVALPQLAASSIWNEREQQLWELLQLSPLEPAQLARGKFTSSLLSGAAFLVVTAPLSALALLFGGVTLSELVAAYVYMMALAILATWLGLTTAATATTKASALARTAGWSALGWVATYVGLGWGVFPFVGAAWPEIPETGPLWLPSAWVHAPLSVPSVVLLLLIPLALWGVLVSLLYHLTARAVTSQAHRSSRGLQRWLLTTTPLIWLIFLSARLWVVDRQLHWLIFVVATLGVSAHGWLCQLLMVSEGSASRRRVAPELPSVPRFGHARAQWRVLLLSWLGIGLMLALGLGQEWVNARWLGLPRRHLVIGLIGVGMSAAAFLAFTGGLVVQLRRRGLAATTTRAALGLTSAAILVGPWLLAGVASLLRGDAAGTPKALLAAGSPCFSLLALQRLHGEYSDASSYVLASVLATGGWFVLASLLWSLQPGSVTRARREATAPPPPAVKTTERASPPPAAGTSTSPPPPAVKTTERASPPPAAGTSTSPPPPAVKTTERASPPPPAPPATPGAKS